MASEIKVDTISEQTSANGVTIDGLTIKDGNIIGDVALAGTTPTFTIGDAGAEDASLIFDGNAQDFYVALDDSADDLVIGLGNTIGTTPIMSFDENKDVVIHDGGLTTTTDDNTFNLTLVSTDADANSGPNMKLYRNSGSPANNDIMGNVYFTGRNDNSQDVAYAHIETLATDVSDGAEDGYMNIYLAHAGTEQRSRIEMDSTETVFNEGSADLDFRVESNGNANMLFVNGGTDKVGIGLADPTGTFHVKTNNAGTTMYIEDSHAGNGDGPELYLYRNSSSPADADDIGIIKFLGKNDAGQDAIYGQIKSIIVDASDGTEDGKIEFYHMFNGSLAPSLQLTTEGVIINESSNDIDFRVESNGNTHMLFVDGGNNAVGIGTSTLDAQVHIMKNDSGALLDANADNLFIEDTSATGITIGSSNSGEGHIRFSDSDDADVCSISYFHADDSLRFRVNTNDFFRISDGGKIMTGGETAPDVSDGGLCIDVNTGDGNNLSLKSSDIAHGRTSVAETDTYAEFHKAGINDGGLQITSLNDTGNIAFYMDAHARSIDTGKGTGDHGTMNFDANTHDGSNSGTSLTSNGNMVTFSNDNSVRFIFDAEGDIHVDGSSSISTYDAYEDAQLIRAYDLSHGAGVIASQFDKFVQYNKDDLTDAGLVGRVNHETLKDGTEAKPLINMTGFVRLHNGAIWQQYEKHQKLASAFYKLAEKTIGKEEADKLLTEEEIQLLN